MTAQFDFDIKSSGEISTIFVERSILTFKHATLFVRQLPYSRNPDKNDLKSLFTDNCGTCSTIHALLKQLADENNFNEIKLMVGLFKMNEINTPKIASTLKHNGLDYIPEAHCYLKYYGIILDFTRLSAKPSDFMDDLIEEIEITPDQITEFKVNHHK